MVWFTEWFMKFTIPFFFTSLQFGDRPLHSHQGGQGLGENRGSRLSGPRLLRVFWLNLPTEHTWPLRAGYVAGRNKGFPNHEFFAPLRCCSHTCRKSTFNLADFSLVFQPRSPYVPKMSAALSVKPAMEFLLAHKCRFNLFAFASDLYQHNEVWDLMGSCQNQIPLTLIPAPCSV